VGPGKRGRREKAVRARRGDLRAALKPDLRTPPRGRARRWASPSPLADDLAAILADEAAGVSCDALARRLRRRKADVLACLRGDPRFVRSGAGRGSRWRLAPHDSRLGAWEQLGTDPGVTRGYGATPPVPDAESREEEVAA